MINTLSNSTKKLTPDSHKTVQLEPEPLDDLLVAQPMPRPTLTLFSFTARVVEREKHTISAPRARLPKPHTFLTAPGRSRSRAFYTFPHQRWELHLQTTRGTVQGRRGIRHRHGPRFAAAMMRCYPASSARNVPRYPSALLLVLS